MKTLFSLFTILLFSFTMINCSPNSRIKDLQDQLESSNKLLAKCKSTDTVDLRKEGIAFISKTGNNQMLKVVYYFKSGLIIDEIVDFKRTDTSYRLQTFLVGCDDEKHEKIEFRTIEDFYASKEHIIPIDSMPHSYPIKQPGASPTAPRPMISFTIFKKDPCTPPKTGTIKMGPKAVYTVEMN